MAGELRTGGRVVALDFGWDRHLGRRYYALWYLATALLALAAVGLWADRLILAVLVAAALPLYWLAHRTLRRAHRIPRLVRRPTAPRLVHPLMLTRKHEPGTWWSRWAAVDLALLATAVTLTQLALL
jgi:hypothetical protein